MANSPISNQQVLSSYGKALTNLKSAHDKAMDGATHFHVFGLSIPKGPLGIFSQGKTSQIDQNYQQAIQIEGQIYNSITQGLGLMAKTGTGDGSGSSS